MDIGLFSQRNVQGWAQKQFSGLTNYSIHSIDNRSVLAAYSQQSASAFYIKKKIDLEKTPFLNWSWSKQQLINPGNETEKSGDDFVARLYVIKDGGLLYWNTRVINYVWSYQHRKNETWDNPFAGKKAKMLSLEDATSAEKAWFSEKRHVKNDFARLHGKNIRFIDGIALMTDSDNSGLSAKAYYGDIYFSEN